MLADTPASVTTPPELMLSPVSRPVPPVLLAWITPLIVVLPAPARFQVAVLLSFVSVFTRSPESVSKAGAVMPLLMVQPEPGAPLAPVTPPASVMEFVPLRLKAELLMIVTPLLTVNPPALVA